MGTGQTPTGRHQARTAIDPSNRRQWNAQNLTLVGCAYRRHLPRSRTVVCGRQPARRQRRPRHRSACSAALSATRSVPAPQRRAGTADAPQQPALRRHPHNAGTPRVAGSPARRSPSAQSRRNRSDRRWSDLRSPLGGAARPRGQFHCDRNPSAVSRWPKGALPRRRRCAAAVRRSPVARRLRRRYARPPEWCDPAAPAGRRWPLVSGVDCPQHIGRLQSVQRQWLRGDVFVEQHRHVLDGERLKRFSFHDRESNAHENSAMNGTRLSPQSLRMSV